MRVVDSDEQNVYIISGNFRGGTTAVAQLLEKAGISMGDYDKKVGNYEDTAFQKLLLQPKVDLKELKELVLIREEASKGESWGFKFPGAHIHMPKILEAFNKPVLIFVFRDPVAVADSEHRRAGQDKKVMMDRTIAYNFNMLQLYRNKELTAPMFLVSFEQLLLRPTTVVSTLLNELGLHECKKDPKVLKELVDSIKLKKDEHSFDYEE